ncbi:hypothetical protein GmHk_01G000782 [Glycine max]|nr:hypothetical protein GmHk_01G000782 [Glycine max]
MEAISKIFEDLDISRKVTLKSKLQEIAYLDLSSMCALPEKVKTKGCQKKWMTKQQRSMKCDLSYWEYVDALHSVQNSSSTLKHSASSSSEQTKPKRKMPMLDQFHPCMQNFIENIVDVKANGNCGYRVIAALLGLGEDSWSSVRNHLPSHYMYWSSVWQSFCSSIAMITMCVFLRNSCPMLTIALLWSTHCHYEAKQWPTSYISRMHQYTSSMRLTTQHVDLGED